MSPISVFYTTLTIKPMYGIPKVTIELLFIIFIMHSYLWCTSKNANLSLELLQFQHFFKKCVSDISVVFIVLCRSGICYSVSDNSYICCVHSVRFSISPKGFA